MRQRHNTKTKPTRRTPRQQKQQLKPKQKNLQNPTVQVVTMQTINDVVDFEPNVNVVCEVEVLTKRCTFFFLEKAQTCFELVLGSVVIVGDLR